MTLSQAQGLGHVGALQPVPNCSLHRVPCILMHTYAYSSYLASLALLGIFQIFQEASPVAPVASHFFTWAESLRPRQRVVAALDPETDLLGRDREASENTDTCGNLWVKTQAHKTSSFFLLLCQVDPVLRISDDDMVGHTRTTFQRRI